MAEAIQQGGAALLLTGDLYLGQAGDLHQPQQHGGMAVHTAAAGHQTQQLPPVQSHHLAGQQFIRDQDPGAGGQGIRCIQPQQAADDPVGDVPYIRPTGPHIGAVHAGEGTGKIPLHHLDGVFCRGVTAPDDGEHPLH